MVPMEGVEPTHSFEYQILSLARLPIPPHRLYHQMRTIHIGANLDLYHALASESMANEPRNSCKDGGYYAEKESRRNMNRKRYSMAGQSWT